MQVYEKSTTRVPNYTQIYFPYSTLTSACQGLACTRTVSIFRTLSYMQTRFRHQKQTILHRYWNEINSKSIATQLFYQHTPIDTAIYEKFVCYNDKPKYTDLFITQSVLTSFFPVDPDDRVIMESQCIIKTSRA